MKTNKLIVTITFLVLWQSSQGQGFLNMDFEDATIAPTPIGGSTYPADPAQAFPGWTVLPNSSSVYPTVMIYNSLSLGAPAVDLMGPNFPNRAGYASLQGSYSVLLQYFGISGPPCLSQTGLVPGDAQSIDFLVGNGQGDAVVTLNGVNIPLFQISGGRLAGNISDFAGTIAQLSFSTTSNTGYAGNWLYFDDIQFSSTPVPEPSTLTLGALGTLLFGFRRWRK